MIITISGLQKSIHPKKCLDGASTLLGVEYAKNANVHGYKRGEYFGRDGWNMNSSQAKATFLGSLTGVPNTIHCLVLDKCITIQQLAGS